MLVTGAAGGAVVALVVVNVTDDDVERVERIDLGSVAVADPTRVSMSVGGSSSGGGNGPVTQVDPVVEPDVTMVPVPTLPAGQGVVPGLTELTGTVQLVGDEFVIDGRELDIGPDRWITTTTAPDDVDGDGAAETWWLEVSGLTGRTVTVLGDVDDDDVDAFEIAGVAVRPVYSDVPPWSDDWVGGGVSAEIEQILATGISADDAVQRALEQVPGVAVDVKIDVNDGRPYWEVDVRSTDGALYDVEIDAVDGSIVEIDRSGR